MFKLYGAPAPRLLISLILLLDGLTVSGTETQTWDTAAGCLMVEEAGGVISDIAGSKWHLQSPNLLASNGLIHQQMISVLSSKS